MIGQILSSGPVRIAAACVILGFILLAWTTTVAIRPPRPQTKLEVLELPALRSSVESDSSISDSSISDIIDRDPFSSSWREQILATPSPSVAPPLTILDSLHLVGTVVDSSGGSFVLCQMGVAPIRVLRVGQELGAYQLHSVSQGSAIFVTNAGHRLELHVPKPGS